jgi:hypothetical protein
MKDTKQLGKIQQTLTNLVSILKQCQDPTLDSQTAFLKILEELKDEISQLEGHADKF